MLRSGCSALRVVNSNLKKQTWYQQKKGSIHYMSMNYLFPPETHIKMDHE